MDKRHLLGNESLDPDSFVCVNPYEVNPLTDSTLDYTLIADIPLKAESRVSQRSQDGISCGGFYRPQGKIKLEMEEFADLAPFVSQKRTSTNSIDELNTPVFTKDAFDFDITNYENNVHADFHVTLKYDPSVYLGRTCHTSVNFNQACQDFDGAKDIFLNTDSMRRNVTILPLENNGADAQHIYSPPASENGTYVENMSPSTITVLDYDMNNSDSVNLDSSNSTAYGRKDNLSPYGHNKSSYGQITPEGSEKSYISDDTKIFYDPHCNSEQKTPNRQKLSLDFSLGSLAALGEQTGVLDVSTPNLIAEVVSLEATGFNILDLVKEDNSYIQVEDIFSPTSLQQTESQSKISQKIAVKQPRKRHVKFEDYDDDDEDYVPPTKKSSNQKKSSRKVREYASSDSESEEERERPRKKGRGRPPKRTESVSSDCSLGSNDVSRYRELRDKNNEASRKSRLKRKIKEVEIEKEADELNNRNIKLKAQVEELEKMVNNFRDNLFKIMINK